MRKMRMFRAVCLLLCLCLLAGMLAACGKKDDSSSLPPPVSLPVLPTPASVPSSVAPPPPSSSLPPPPSSSEAPPPSSVSVAPVQQPAPVWVDGAPSVSASGRTVTVTFKTDVPSAVNTILTTNGTAPSTNAFYDYFNRGKALDGAAAKQKVHSVTSSGKSISFELPDPAKTYYVLSNAAEDATGTWQNTVTVTKVYEPGSVAPVFIKVDYAGINSDGYVTIVADMMVPCTIYAIVMNASGTPTAQQVRDGGAGYNGTILSTSACNTNAAAPFIATAGFPKDKLPAGNTYYAYVVAQYGSGPLSEVGKVVFTI